MALASLVLASLAPMRAATSQEQVEGNRYANARYGIEITKPSGWMSPADRPLITIMLDHRTELELTPDQVTRLEGLRNDFARDAIRRGAEVRIAELDLGTLLEQDPPDMAKVEAKVREVAQLRADLRIARLRTIEQGKAVLTAEQKVRLQGMLTGGPMGPPRSAGTGTRL